MVGRHLAESLLKAFDTARWDLGPTDRIFANEPRVIGLVNELSVLAAGSSSSWQSDVRSPGSEIDWMLRVFDLKALGISTSRCERPLLDERLTFDA